LGAVSSNQYRVLQKHGGGITGNVLRIVEAAEKYSSLSAARIPEPAEKKIKDSRRRRLGEWGSG